MFVIIDMIVFSFQIVLFLPELHYMNCENYASKLIYITNIDLENYLPNLHEV